MGGKDMTDQIIQALVNGLVSGSIYALMAIGFTLVFGIMHVINLAHGELYMLGAFTTFILVGVYEINFFVSLVIAAFIVGVLGFFIERFIFRPLRKTAMLNTLLASIGLSIFLSNLVLQIAGPQMRTIAFPFGTEEIAIFGITMTIQRLLIVGITAALVISLFVIFKFTKFGKALRAT